MKISFITLGCKVNQNETGALEQLFYDRGYEPAAPGSAADVVVVNSCTVTTGGDKKSLQMLRRCRRENPGAVLILTGCYPQAFPQEAAAALEADIVTGTQNRGVLVEDLSRFLRTGERIVDIRPHQVSDPFEELATRPADGYTRAFVKVEDGCDRYCSYCIIPKARGFVRSRGEEAILRDLRLLAERGYREIVLTGINLCRYGSDTGTDLSCLVEHAASVNGIERIRLGSVEADLLTDEQLVRMSGVRKLCPQFHLSLQSGCARTLKAMNRRYTPQQYLEKVERMRDLFSDPLFTTDIITGFPGETDSDHEESAEFVQKIGFLKVHVFGYSVRPGTAAALLPDQVGASVRNERTGEMIRICSELRRSVIDRRAGSEDTVLLEQALSRNTFTGYTTRYIPVAVSAPGAAAGQIVRVRLGRFDGSRCRAAISAR